MGHERHICWRKMNKWRKSSQTSSPPASRGNISPTLEQLLTKERYLSYVAYCTALNTSSCPGRQIRIEHERTVENTSFPWVRLEVLKMTMPSHHEVLALLYHYITWDSPYLHLVLYSSFQSVLYTSVLPATSSANAGSILLCLTTTTEYSDDKSNLILKIQANQTLIACNSHCRPSHSKQSIAT